MGFSEPPENIGKTNENFLGEADENLMVIIGLQECKANSWIDFFQNKLKSKFSLISVVTMWRVNLNFNINYLKKITDYIDDFMCLYQKRMDKLREKY